MSEAVLAAARAPVVRAALRDRFRRGAQARSDDLRLALGTLAAHKLRSFLTLLGIVIGVFTVVAMMALLDGLSPSLNNTMGPPRPALFPIPKSPPLNFRPP